MAPDVAGAGRALVALDPRAVQVGRSAEFTLDQRSGVAGEGRAGVSSQGVGRKVVGLADADDTHAALRVTGDGIAAGRGEQASGGHHHARTAVAGDLVAALEIGLSM